jgi:hypothetical protein
MVVALRLTRFGLPLTPYDSPDTGRLPSTNYIQQRWPSIKLSLQCEDALIGSSGHSDGHSQLPAKIPGVNSRFNL